MADDRAAQQAFIDTLLEWDYAAMFDRYEEGKGVADQLPAIDQSFASVEVLHQPLQLAITPPTAIRHDRREPPLTQRMHTIHRPMWPHQRVLTPPH